MHHREVRQIIDIAAVKNQHRTLLPVIAVSKPEIVLRKFCGISCVEAGASAIIAGYKNMSYSRDSYDASQSQASGVTERRLNGRVQACWCTGDSLLGIVYGTPDTWAIQPRLPM